MASRSAPVLAFILALSLLLNLGLFLELRDVRQQAGDLPPRGTLEFKGFRWSPRAEIGVDLASPPSGAVTVVDEYGNRVISDTFPSKVYTRRLGNYTVSAALTIFVAGEKLYFRHWEASGKIISIHPTLSYFFLPGRSDSVLWAIYLNWNVEVKSAIPSGEVNATGFAIFRSDTRETSVFPTPSNLAVTEGVAFTVTAPASIIVNGIEYSFTRWKDGFTGEVFSYSNQIVLAADRFYLIWAEYG